MCISYVFVYELSDNKHFLIIYKELLLRLSFFNIGYNGNILAEFYFIGVVQHMSLKERNRAFCNNSVVTSVRVYKPGKLFGETQEPRLD